MAFYILNLLFLFTIAAGYTFTAKGPGFCEDYSYPNDDFKGGLYSTAELCMNACLEWEGQVGAVQRDSGAPVDSQAFYLYPDGGWCGCSTGDCVLNDNHNGAYQSYSIVASPSCSDSPCLNGANCTDVDGGVSCTCLAGYSGDDCGTESACGQAPDFSSYSVEEIDTTTCDKVLDGDCPALSCLSGYEGSPATLSCPDEDAWQFTGSPCTNIDDCVGDPCGNQGNCVDGVNSYACVCNPGWSGGACDTDIRTGVMFKQMSGIYFNGPDIQPNSNDEDMNTADIVARAGIIFSDFSTAPSCYEENEFTLAYFDGAMRFCDGINWREIITTTYNVDTGNIEIE